MGYKAQLSQNSTELQKTFYQRNLGAWIGRKCTGEIFQPKLVYFIDKTEFSIIFSNARLQMDV